MTGKNYICDVYSANDILPSNRVSAIIQEPSGFMWFDTESGLVRYDGFNAVVSEGHQGSEYYNFLKVTKLIYMKKFPGIIIILMMRQIAFYDTQQKKFLNTKFDKPLLISGSESMENAFECGDDLLWIEEEGKIRVLRLTSSGKNIINAEQVLYLRISGKLKYVEKNKEKEGSYRIITQTGIYDVLLNDESDPLRLLLLFPPAMGMANSAIKYAENIYLTGAENAVFLADMKTGKTEIPYELKHLKFIRSVSVTGPENNMIIMTRSSLHRVSHDLMKTEEMILVPHKSGSIVGNDFHNLYTDSFGIIWISTLQSGVIKIDPLKQDFSYMNRILSENGFSSHLPVWSFFENPDGSILLGSNGELIRISADRKKADRLLNFNNNLFSTPNQIRAILREITDGTVIYWLSVFNYGLVKYTPSNGELKSFAQKDREVFYYSIAFDFDGSILIGSNDGGLLRFDKKTESFEEIILNQQPQNRQWIISMTPKDDKTGFLMPTYDSGILFYSSPIRAIEKADDFQNLRDGSSRYNFTSVIPAGNGTYLAGTLSDGLMITDRNFKVLKVHTMKEGLPDNNIYAIVKDDFGYFWLGTGRGITRFDPEKGHFLNYSFNDGLAANDINLNSFSKSSDGCIRFGTNFGVVSFNPEEINRSFSKPPFTNFTSFSKNGKEYLKINNENISPFLLPNDESALTITFTGIHFPSGEKVNYRYKIIGYNENWVYTGKENILRFLSLPAGDYEIIVQSANAAGIWDLNGDRIKFTVSKKFWAETWFLVLSFITLLLLIYLITALRVRALLKTEEKILMERIRIRTKLNEDLHDELGHKLTSIILLSETLSSAGSQLPEHLRSGLITLNSKFTELFNEIREFNWVMNPGKDSHDDLSEYIWKLVDRLLDKSEISFDLNAEQVKTNLISLNINQKNTIVKVIKESVINTLKHSQNCSSVKIDISIDDVFINVTITDDGAGFDPGNNHEGNGLKMNKARAAQVGGEIAVISAPGKGTKVILRIPFDQTAEYRNLTGKILKLFSPGRKNLNNQS